LPNERREARVGFALKNDTAAISDEETTPVNDRIMTMILYMVYYVISVIYSARGSITVNTTHSSTVLT